MSQIIRKHEKPNCISLCKLFVITFLKFPITLIKLIKTKESYSTQEKQIKRTAKEYNIVTMDKTWKKIMEQRKDLYYW